MSEWWQKPLRAVTLEFPASDVATIDVKGIVDETSQGGVNVICVFSIGYYPGGTAFYQSKIAPHFPGLGERDLLAEAIEAGHAHGQKIIAYIASIWGGRELFLAHPDWAQRKANGEVTAWDEEFNSVAFCPNSPYREYLFSILDEICRNYPIDGFYFDEPSFQSWCNCENCQSKFYAEYGYPIPTEIDWKDAGSQTFIAWRYQQISQWREALYRAVKTDDRCVFFQGPFPLSRFSSGMLRFSGLELPNPYQMRFGVDWYIPMAHAADLAHDAKIADVLHFELYRRAVQEPLWWYGICLRYGQSIGSGKQMLVLNMMAQTPFDLLGLPEAELRLSVGEILANSGSPLFARYYPDQVDQSAWKKVYTLLKEAEDLEPYLSERESLKYAAVLFSETSLNRFDHLPDKPAHLGCLKGFAKALLQEKVPFDIITEADLAKTLTRYKVLVLPNTSCLDSAAKDAIRKFVMKGGGIVGSFETGMYDALGQRSSSDDLGDLFGISYGETPPIFYGFDVYMEYQSSLLNADIQEGKRIPTGGIQIEISPKGAIPVASVLGGATVHYGPLGREVGAPAILAHNPETRGRGVFFAPPLGVRYLEFGVEDMRKLIGGAVRWAARSAPPIWVENAPLTLALSAFSQPSKKRWVIHLVNSIQEEIIRPITEIPECIGVRLWVENTGGIKDVGVLGSPNPPRVMQRGDQLCIELAPFRYSAIVLVNFA